MDHSPNRLNLDLDKKRNCIDVKRTSFTARFAILFVLYSVLKFINTVIHVDTLFSLYIMSQKLKSQLFLMA